EHLASELDEHKNQLLKANEEVEVLRVKHDGDKVEMELLRDQISALERSLSRTQEENKSLKIQLDRLSNGPAVDVDKSDELQIRNIQLLKANDELQKKLKNTEDAKNKLEQVSVLINGMYMLNHSIIGIVLFPHSIEY
ncbi:hypothetical protein LSH36_115g13123, partial [Paralvinella palmiformis]